MLELNPILFRELIRAARRPQLYVLRAALPAAVILWVAPKLLVVLAQAGRDWRSVAAVARPAFVLCGWVGIVVLPLLTWTYTERSLREEWARRTIELICITPVSRMTLLLSKFAGVLGRIALLALALAPVMGVGIHLGRMPAGVAARSLAVLGAGILFLGGLGLVQAATCHPHRAWVNAGACLAAAYMFAVVPWAVWSRHPAAIAAIPPWSFYYVISDRAPAGISAGAFALLSILLPLGVGTALVACAPWLFDRTFERYVSGQGADRRAGSLAAASRRRPELNPGDNAFYWHEQPRSTRIIAVGVWSVVAGGWTLAAVVSGLMRGFRATFTDPWFYLGLSITAASAFSLVCGLYGAEVFLREKRRNTAKLLIMTGCSPALVYRGKLRAVLRPLRWAWAAAAAPLAVYALLGGRPVVVAALLVWILGAVGPRTACVIAMVFGAAARGMPQVITGVVSSPLYTILFSGLTMLAVAILSVFLPGVGAVLGYFAAPYVLFGFVFTAGRQWTVTQLSGLLGVTLFFCGSVAGFSAAVGARAAMVALG